jgi:translation initiation factor 3 subunit L
LSLCAARRFVVLSVAPSCSPRADNGSSSSALIGGEFIVPSVPDFGKPVNSSFEAFRLQTRLFNEEVAQHKNVSRIRSYLKLYTSIDLEKLAKFNDMTADEFRTELVAIKHKSNNGGAAAATVGGAGAGPEDADAPATVASLDVHYYVEGDMIHIDEPEKEQRHEAYFIGQIAKIGDVVADIERLPAKAVKP